MEKEKSPSPPPSNSTLQSNPSNSTLKSDHSTNSTTNSTLKSLNKSSFKISKPNHHSTLKSVLPPPLPPPPPPDSGGSAGSLPPPQPPVYNIDKNNFREIVQKLTGSPSPPVPSPAPPRPAAPPPQIAGTSRLHRIRPPPLANLSPRPPQIGAQAALSPLPPLPAVGITAESPVSAYLRRIQAGAAADLAFPASPLGLGFGCASPRTAYQMMMMTSSAGLPTSPGVPPLPAPSPREGR